jgi:hypothetical protein
MKGKHRTIEFSAPAETGRLATEVRWKRVNNVLKKLYIIFLINAFVTLCAVHVHAAPFPDKRGKSGPISPSVIFQYRFCPATNARYFRAAPGLEIATRFVADRVNGKAKGRWDPP